MVLKRMNILLVFLIFVISIENVWGWRTFWKGRRDGGNLVAPHQNIPREQLPPDQWFDQNLDHFTDKASELWQQVNASFVWKK